MPALALAGTIHPAAHQAARPAPRVLRTTRLESAWHGTRKSAPALGTYTVRAGDTLAGISARLLGSADRWPDLWWWNRDQVKNPNIITEGQVLTIYRWRVPYASWEPWVQAQALAAIPKPPPPPPVQTAASVQVPQSQPDVPQPQVPQPQGNVSTAGMSGFEACVIARESGGNPQIWNPTGHWGLFQFDLGTWISGGGTAASFGNAPASVQQQVFDNVYAARGVQPWQPSDGCS